MAQLAERSAVTDFRQNVPTIIVGLVTSNYYNTQPTFMAGGLPNFVRNFGFMG